MSIVSVVELDHEPYWCVLHRGLEESGGEGRLVLFDTLDNSCAHAAGSDSHEIPGRVVSVLIDVLHAPNVDPNGAAGTKNPCRITTACGNLECPAKVAAGAARQDTEFNVFS